MDLDDCPILDHHAHPLLPPEHANFTASFSASHQEDLARHSLFFRRSMHDLARLYGSAPEERSVISTRSRFPYDELVKLCFERSSISEVFLDDGFPPNAYNPQWHSRFVTVRRIVRLEQVAERLMAQIQEFSEFVEAYRQSLLERTPDTVAFKTIAAYRCGLSLPMATAQEAEAVFKASRETQAKRLTNPHLIGFLLTQALDVASYDSVPIQVHTGFGDQDLHLTYANPLLLRPWMEDARWGQVPFVLLHAAYPYVREAAWLASILPNVYVDIGLAVPSLSVQGMQAIVRMLLELAPYTRVLYSSDAGAIPELYYLAARWGRRVVGDVLEKSVEMGELATPEAEEIARRVLLDNARVLYYKERPGASITWSRRPSEQDEMMY
ncbi:MAG: amidohydrolase family protein [Candidatus Xenobia bacterium]